MHLKWTKRRKTGCTHPALLWWHFRKKKNTNKGEPLRRWDEKRREFSLPLLPSVAKKKGNPTTNGGMQIGSPVEMCTHCLRVFWTLCARFCMLSQCLRTKFPSESELCRKFAKSALLVGKKNCICSVVRRSGHKKVVWESTRPQGGSDPDNWLTTLHFPPDQFPRPP